MDNLNVKYNLTKVYNDSKDFGSKHKDEDILSTPDTSLLTTAPNALVQTNNKLIISLARIVVDQKFDSLYSSYIASKQIRIIIQNKLTIVAKEKLDKVYIDL